MADEQRMQAYGALIEQLLNCPQGEEANILQNHSDLVDAGLLAAMEQVAVYLDGQGNGNAQWLRGFATQLAGAIGLETSTQQDLETARQFLWETLQLVSEKRGDSQQIYSIWAQQQERFNEELLAVLPSVAVQLLQANTESPIFVSAVFGLFGNLIQNFPLGTRWLNLELSIAACEQSLQMMTRETMPDLWAESMNSLAMAYSNRIQGDRADNLEQTIKAYELVLQVYTREAFPQDWAATQYNLAIAYFERVRGDRVDNLEQAIKAYELALQVYTCEAFPKDWADTQYNLGITYSKRIRGDRAENLEQEIIAYELALQVRTREAFPQDWAATQNNLAIAYSNRIRGDRAENIEKKIAHYELALQVYTRETFPEKWARIQHYLADIYKDRIQGDRAENIEKEITHYESALQVYTREAFPKDWARIQCNLAISYSNRIQGDRAENIEKEITHYELALQVYTYEAFPEDWARTQDGLATAYSNRIRGDRAENLEIAIATYQLALQVQTRDDFPEDWADTQNNLATAYLYRIRGNRAQNIEDAIAACELALQVRTRDSFPKQWAITQQNLALAYSNRIRGDRAQNIEDAIAAHELALQVRTRDNCPEEWAITQNNIGTAYSERIRGDRVQNIEDAIAAYELALQVRTREATPVEWAMTQHNLATIYSDRIRGDRAQNIEDAIAACELALQVRTREATPVEWAESMSSLANAYLKRIRGDRAQNIEDAIAAYELALQVRTRNNSPTDWAMAQRNLATAYSERIRGDRAQNIEDAITTYKQALQVYTRDDFPEDWAGSMRGLANAYSKRIRGDRAQNIEDAIAAYKQALQVRTRDDFPQDWAQSMHNLANAYAQRIRGDQVQNIEAAMAAYQSSLTVFDPELLPNDCRRTARSLGNLYSKQHRWQEAISIYQKALQASETLYQSANLLDSKAAELAETADLPRRAAYALARAGNLQAAALTLEQGRARGLSETLERDRSDLSQLQQTNQDLFNQYQDIAAQLRNLEAQQRLRMTLEERHNLTPEALRTTALQLRQALTKTIEQIRQVEGYADFLAQPDFNDIQQAVRPDVPLVYLVSTPLGSLALIVTQTGIVDLWLDELNETDLIDLLNDTWFSAYDQSRTNRQGWLDVIDQITHQLWQPSMAPLIDHLKQRSFQQATLIPTGYLSLLPLHAAWVDDPTHPTGKRYALDEICFTYAPNARSLTAAEAIAQQATPGAIVAIDNPLKDLPNSSREVAAAIASFPQPKVLKHEEATVESVLTALPDCNLLHLSCHGTANLREPLNSGLAMNDGLLTLRQFLDLKLSEQGGIRLVVLSACETGLVGTELADEAISLPTGLLQAGVAGVIASLWAVSDLSTMLLLSKFYELWRTENKEPSEALRQAQIWLRDSTEAEIAPLLGMRPRNPTNRPFSHPYYWAAFSYTGV